MYGLKGQYSVIVHRGEAFLIVALSIQFTHDPDAAQTVCEIVTNGFALSSHFLIVVVYREAFV